MCNLLSVWLDSYNYCFYSEVNRPVLLHDGVFMMNSMLLFFKLKICSNSYDIETMVGAVYVMWIGFVGVLSQNNEYNI